MQVSKGRAFRADQELPPSALLITSPRRTSKHVTVGRRVRRGQVTSVHFTETCEANAPHLSVDVITTAATTPDGEIMGDLHEQLAEHEMLPDQHLVDMGYVDADVLAQGQNRYQVDVVGPVMPDLSWLALGGCGL